MCEVARMCSETVECRPQQPLANAAKKTERRRAASRSGFLKRVRGHLSRDDVAKRCCRGETTEEALRRRGVQNRFKTSPGACVDFEFSFVRMLERRPLLRSPEIPKAIFCVSPGNLNGRFAVALRLRVSRLPLVFTGPSASSSNLQLVRSFLFV